MYSPRHKQEETAPQLTSQSYESVEAPDVIPDIAPDDPSSYESVNDVYKLPDAPIDTSPAFEIPGLVPDEEFVPPRPLESTNPGVLSFSVPRRGGADRSAPNRSTMYAHSKQRRQEIETFTALALEREAQREQSRVAYELSRQALSQTIGRGSIEAPERDQ